MKTKNLFSTFLILAFLLTACGQTTAAPASVTQIPVATQPPTDIPTQTALPTIASFGSTYPTPIPYPTASVVKSNAVAFIAENTLWVANVDGSGERKLTGFAKNDSLGRVQMQWSPNGKWISYISNEELWLISPDGSTKKKVLSLSDGNIGKLYTYVWSPDSTQIVFENWYSNKKLATPTPGPESWQMPVLIGIIDLKTEEISVVSIHDSNDPMPLSWSPNGQYIIFAKDFSYNVYEVATRKVIKEIKVQYACWIGWHTWSPNSKWFVHTHHGTGMPWTCVGGLDGSNQEINVNSFSGFVWDETGNFLYFVAREDNPDNTLNLKVDEQLMRYDVRTQETKRLLSLTIKQTPYSFMHSIFISPDRHTLLLRSQYSETKFDLVFINLQSLATTKYTVDFKDLKVPFRYSYFLETAWTPDNQNLIILAGDFCTPSGCGGDGPRGYGSFYTLNIKTGKVSIFSGEHSIYSWQVSPIATAP